MSAGAGVVVRLLEPEDAEAVMRLRREALETEPFSFSASVEDDRGLDPVSVRAALGEHEDRATFGAFVPELAGMVGLRREAQRKGAHSAGIWGMYVRPGARGRGVGDALLSAALARARAMEGVTHVRLCVTEAAPAALRLYLRHGFERWGTEPDALRHDGRTVAEHHMVLRLR